MFYRVQSLEEEVDIWRHQHQPPPPPPPQQQNWTTGEPVQHLWELFHESCQHWWLPRASGNHASPPGLFLGQFWPLWFPLFLTAATLSEWWSRCIIFLVRSDIQLSLSELSSFVMCSLWFRLVSTWTEGGSDVTLVTTARQVEVPLWGRGRVGQGCCGSVQVSSVSSVPSQPANIYWASNMYQAMGLPLKM